MKSKSIAVDILGICSIVHKCTGCKATAPHAAKCCTGYEVTVNSKEMQNIFDYLPSAARFCTDLKTDDGYDNVFEQLNNDLYCIDTHEDGTCLLAYRKDKKLLCSLHTVAENSGISLGQIKPESCLLWPLAIVEGQKTMALSIQDDVLEFSCNKPNTNDAFSLCPSIAMNIERNFGKEFRMKVKEAVRNRVERVCIPL